VGEAGNGLTGEAGDQGADADVQGLAAAFDPQLCGVKGPIGSLSFEELLAALELVTGRMANGDVGIEVAADLYEQAEILHAAARQRLSAVEARIGRSKSLNPQT
jgi:exodeoxyribonuclease VII small subunit